MMQKMISLLCAIFILSGCCHFTPNREKPETIVRIENEWIGLLFELHVWNSEQTGTIILPGHESEKNKYVRINDQQIKQFNQKLNEIFRSDLEEQYASPKYHYADAPNTEIFYSGKSIRFIQDIHIPYEFIPLMKLISEIIRSNFSFRTRGIVKDFLRTNWDELYKAKLIEDEGK